MLELRRAAMFFGMPMIAVATLPYWFLTRSLLPIELWFELLDPEV